MMQTFKSEKEPAAAIIVAAGQSQRMGQAKQWIDLQGIPVLGHALLAFEKSPCIGAIAVVVRVEDMLRTQDLCSRLRLKKVTAITAGGDTRQQSVAAGLKALPAECSLVAIHDGARPFVTPDRIERVAACAALTGAAAAAVRVKDTIKKAGVDGIVLETPDRSGLWSVQTPQIFNRTLYRKAVNQALRDGKEYTDDCQLMEAAGYPVHLCEGDYQNIKITTPEDIVLARALAAERTGISMRIGHGYDVHRLKEGRPLIIGGTAVPYEKGLDGHSDADVLLHAIMDALLGAAAMGDIGRWFPDTDERFRGADSRVLMAETVRMIREKGYRIGNIDATILAQEPKMKSHISAMRGCIASIAGVAEDQVNVKATTEEGLGFTGEKQGIAAHAVCVLIP